jgi:type IV pilus assembly protein PilB
MIEANLEMTDKIGYLLFKKGIIDAQCLKKLSMLKLMTGIRLKEILPRYLFRISIMIMILIFREVAILYAFRELDTRRRNSAPED